MKWAAIGAAAGTLIFPGVGTIIGGIGGAIVSGLCGIVRGLRPGRGALRGGAA